jgi:hypothetical protein
MKLLPFQNLSQLDLSVTPQAKEVALDVPHALVPDRTGEPRNPKYARSAGSGWNGPAAPDRAEPAARDAGSVADRTAR